MLDDLILIALLLGAYLYWFNGQRAKEIAFKAVKAHCLNLEVQMLDEYVALNSIRLKREQTGKIQLQRTFLFEFSSTGNERYNGVCMMLGRQVESVQMEQYRIDDCMDAGGRAMQEQLPRNPEEIFFVEDDV